MPAPQKTQGMSPPGFLSARLVVTLFAIQPFADDVWNHACRDSNQKGYYDRTHANTPFPLSE